MTTRIGVLGAARIVGDAIVAPAATMPGVEIVAVAARDGDRARAFAAQHHIPTSYGSYDALLAAPDIDAVYIALPPALHARHAIAAVAAGKHVLCEKPFASNAAEAEAMVAAASAAGRVLAEALHYYYHPYAAEMRALAAAHIAGSALPVHLIASFTAPIVQRDDIRRDYALGGGAMLDLGCYGVHWARTLLGGEPTVVSAHAVCEGDIDETTTAQLAFPSGATATIECSMAATARFANSVHVATPAGRLIFANPLAPSAGNSIGIMLGRERSTRSIAGGTTYHYQLAAFVAAIRGGAQMETAGADAIANMNVIDAIYRAAGMRLRGAT